MSIPFLSNIPSTRTPFTTQHTYNLGHGCLHNIFYLSTQVAPHSFSRFLSRLPTIRPQVIVPRRPLPTDPASPARKPTNLRCISLRRCRGHPKTGYDGHVLARLPCLILHGRPGQGLELSYYRSISAGHDIARADSKRMSDSSAYCCLALVPLNRHSRRLSQHRAAIKVTRSEILDSPFSKPSLKPEVRRRLDDIASQTLAHIAVVNSPLALSNRTPPDGISSSAGWSGLETERVCELVVTGTEDAVDLARVRLLVMLDELVRVAASPQNHPSHLNFRADFMRNSLRLTTNFTPSLPTESAICCKPSRRNCHQYIFPFPVARSFGPGPQ